MRAKSAILLVLAGGCGLIAAIGFTKVMANRSAPAQEMEMTPIFVAQETIPTGDIIPIELLKLEEWPTEKIPPGALSKIEDVEDRRTRQRIFKGSPLLDEQLLGQGQKKDDIGRMIPKGLRVVAVKVDSVSGSANLISPKDRVDILVYLQRSPSKGIPITQTKTVLQDIKVFAVDREYDLRDSADDAAPSSVKTVSLLVNPKQAEVVMIASELGKIRLVMRGIGDKVITKNGEGTDPSMLLHQSGGGTDRAPETPTLAANEGPRVSPDIWKFKLIKPSKVEEVVLMLPKESRNTKIPKEGSGLSLWETVTPPSTNGPLHREMGHSSPGQLVNPDVEKMLELAAEGMDSQTKAKEAPGSQATKKGASTQGKGASTQGKGDPKKKTQ